MKKMLILMLVLGMATMANAGLQISVNGNLEPVDSEINIAMSDNLSLDIWTDSEILPLGPGYICLVVDAPGYIDYTTGVVLVSDAGIFLEHSASAVDAGVPLVGENGILGGISLIDLASIAAGTVIFDEILFHCEMDGVDATIKLYDIDDDTFELTLLDSVIVHQIPEPATIALLGLGGLLLRRKK